MIFDRLCSIVENQPVLQYLIPILHKVHLFELPIIPHKVLPQAFEGNTKEFEKNFFLPYPIMAIEDQVSCIVFIDKVENQTGTYSERLFIECLSLATKFEAFRESETEEYTPMRKMEYEFSKQYHEMGYALISIGTIYNMRFKNPENFIGEGSISYSAMMSKTDIKMDGIHKYTQKGLESPLINAYSAVQEIVYFNQPTNFILQEKPIKPRKKKTNKILRSHERPLYTILNPFEIRKRMHLPMPKGTHASPIPHERRRHDRWLSDKRYAFDSDNNPIDPKIIPYGKRKGEIYYKHIDVPAMWIGPSENTHNKKHYKVILNR